MRISLGNRNALPVNIHIILQEMLHHHLVNLPFCKLFEIEICDFTGNKPLVFNKHEGTAVVEASLVEWLKALESEVGTKPKF